LPAAAVAKSTHAAEPAAASWLALPVGDYRAKIAEILPPIRRDRRHADLPPAALRKPSSASFTSVNFSLVLLATSGIQAVESASLPKASLVKRSFASSERTGKGC
jgi:hypothetical protein